MYCCCCGKSFTQDGPYDQLKGSPSWQTLAASRRIELEETGQNRFIRQALVCMGTATEASDGSAEDVEENITECSSSLVMDFLHARVITASLEGGSHRTTCTRNMSLVCPQVILIDPSSPEWYRQSSARLTPEQDHAKDMVPLQNVETNKSSNPSRRSRQPDRTLRR